MARRIVPYARHSAGQVPLGEQPCPGLEFPGCDAGGDVVHDDHVSKIRRPPGGRLDHSCTTVLPLAGR